MRKRTSNKLCIKDEKKKSSEEGLERNVTTIRAGPPERYKNNTKKKAVEIQCQFIIKRTLRRPSKVWAVMVKVLAL